MARSYKPIKTITVHLPPPSFCSSSHASSSTSSSSSSTTTTPHRMTEQAPLEVLLIAQQIALEKGSIFDIESFLTPSQRDKYYTTILHKSPPRPIPKQLPTEPSTPNGVKRSFDDIDGANGGAAAVKEEDSTPKKPKLPSGLAGLHWKQRQKKLAEIARLEAEGERFDPDTLLPIGETPMTPVTTTPTQAKGKGESKPESLVHSASYWNHLLVQARKERGPQWNYHSQSFHFDKLSKEYYTHGLPPRPDTPPPAIKPDPSISKPSIPSTLPPNGNSLGMTNGHPGSSNGQSLLARGQPDQTHPSQQQQQQQQPQRPSLPPSLSSNTSRPTPSLPSQSPYPPTQPTPQNNIRPTPPPHPTTATAMQNLTPQQLASLQSMSNMQMNSGMAQRANQMGIPNAPSGGQGLQGLTPAQMAQMSMVYQQQQQQLHQQQQQGGQGGQPVRPMPPPNMQMLQGLQNLPQFQGMQGMQALQNMQNMQNMQGFQGMQGMQGMGNRQGQFQGGMNGGGGMPFPGLSNPNMGAMGRPPGVGMMTGQGAQGGQNGPGGQGGQGQNGPMLGGGQVNWQEFTA